jgi:hypothetical protein
MSDQLLGIIRWVLLAGVIANILQATILFDWVQRAFMARFAAYGERVGKPVPPWMLDRRIQRGWAIMTAGVFFGFWWFLGTPGGATWFVSNLK